jgi:hypothetical protein
MRSYPRTTLAIALLAAGWIGTAATAARAEERHGDADKTAMDTAAAAAASGGGNVSDGIPIIVGNDGDGHPKIEYRGPSSGSAGAGVPVIVGNDGDGHPKIEYRGAGSGSLSAGVPVITGANGEGRPQIAYLHTSPGSVDGSPASFGK